MVRAEEETREKVGEKEREIEEMRQRIEDVEKVRVVEMKEKGESGWWMDEVVGDCVAGGDDWEWSRCCSVLFLFSET